MIILLNGPPGSGKDTAAEFIIRALGNSKVHHMKFSRPMKSGIRTIFGFNTNEARALESYKDMSNGPEFADLSYREMQIKLFEHMKDTYGPQILGQIFIRHERESMKKYTVVSDCGLSIELEPVVQAFPYKHLYLIQLDRPGCNFDNDIREYVGPHRGIGHFEKIDNKHDLELFEQQVRRVLRKWELLDEEA